MTKSRGWNETTKNLLKALREYVPPEPKPTIWKLVYNPLTEKPTELTAGDVDEGSAWIEISAMEAEQLPQHDPRVRIQNGRIVRISLPGDHRAPTSPGLGVYEHESGEYSTSDYNMLILDPGSQRRWRVGRIS